MKRSERVRTAINLGLANTNVKFDPADRVATEFLADLRDGVLAELSHLPIVPKFEGVQGIDYTVEAIEDVRSELVRLRDHAKRSDEASWVVIIDHALVYLALLVDIFKEHNDATS